MDSNNKKFTEIYNAYYKKAFYFAKSYVHDEGATEDIASESLIKLWEQLKLKDLDPIVPFLIAILKNKSLDYLKHEEVKRSTLSEMASWRDYDLSIRISSLEACDPDEIFSGEVEAIVSKTLQSLPAQSRRIFVMSRFQHKTNNEIAQTLGLSAKAVEYHITKTLKLLRVALKDYLPAFIFLFI